MIPILSKLTINPKPPTFETSEIGVFYGHSDEATRYKGIVDDLMLIGNWVSFMSKGVGFQYSYNTGYSGRLVSLRYFPRKIAIKDIPAGFPSELNTGLSFKKDIRNAIETIHITSIDAFYYGIFGLVERVVEAIRLQEISQGRAQLSDADAALETIVDGAAMYAEGKSSSVGMCVVQNIMPILRGEGGYNFAVPFGFSLQLNDLKHIAFIKMIEYLQTTFIEIGARYEAGEDENLSVYEDLVFIWTNDKQQHQEIGIRAAKARFDRRIRRYFHPFTSVGNPTRGLEVVNYDGIFDANIIRQLRLENPGSINHFHVEMAARLFFLVVHPLQIVNTNDDSIYRHDRYYVSRVNQTVSGDNIMRPDLAAPITQDAITFLRQFNKTMAGEGVKKRRAYGRSELGLFPLIYEEQAVKLYEQMVYRAVHDKRYVGVCGCDSTFNMTWLRLDLNPTRKEGTLDEAIEQYEHESDNEELQMEEVGPDSLNR